MKEDVTQDGDIRQAFDRVLSGFPDIPPLCTKKAAGKNFIALARIALQKGWSAEELVNFVLLIDETVLGAEELAKQYGLKNVKSKDADAEIDLLTGKRICLE